MCIENHAVEHRYHFFYFYIYPVTFKYLPPVMAQEQSVCDDPRASYEVTKSTKSLRRSRAHRGRYTRVLPLLTPWIPYTVRALKWWLRWHRSPGILAHNTSISRHSAISTTRSRSIVGTRLLRYIMLQAFNFVYIFLQNYIKREVQTSLVFPLNSIPNIATDRRSSGTPDVTSHSIRHCN